MEDRPRRGPAGVDDIRIPVFDGAVVSHEEEACGHQVCPVPEIVGVAEEMEAVVLPEGNVDILVNKGSKAADQPLFLVFLLIVDCRERKRGCEDNERLFLSLSFLVFP